jgi:hypothetical protein
MIRDALPSLGHARCVVLATILSGKCAILKEKRKSVPHAELYFMEGQLVFLIALVSAFIRESLF